MSEEREIEKQLRATAEKRRKDAGAPFEIHPATRRLLQGEVARTRGQQTPRRFAVFWPRWVWGVSMLAVLVIGTWAFLQKHEQPKQVALLEAKPELRKTAGYVQQATLPTEKAPATPAMYHAESDADTVAARSAAPPPVSIAANEVAGEKLDAAAAIGKDALADRAQTFAAAAEPAEIERQIYNYRNDAAGNIALAKKASDVKLKVEAPAKLSDANVLLTSFQLEQNGNQIRITDRDGSTYDGVLLADVADKEVATRELETVKSLPATESLQRGREKSSAQSIGGSVAQNVRFAAVGTNLSLKQHVTISGEIVPETNFASNSARQNAQTDQLKAKVQGGVWISNGRLVGKAVMADGQEVQLNATQIPAR